MCYKWLRGVLVVKKSGPISIHLDRNVWNFRYFKSNL